MRRLKMCYDLYQVVMKPLLMRAGCKKVDSIEKIAFFMSKIRQEHDLYHILHK
jgi:ubiquinone biosynthesis protein Coq4